MASQSSSSIPITKIIDMKPGMKNLNVMFIVLERGSTTKTKEGGIIVQHLVADSTASITASLWDEKGEALQPGDIFIMNGGYASLYKTSLMLYCSRYGSIERVGEFTFLFSEQLNISNFEWIPDANAPGGYIQVESRTKGGIRSSSIHPTLR